MKENDNKSLSIILHEMRSPINTIIGLVDMAKKNLNNIIDTENYLNKIMNISKYLLSLSNNILDFSKLEYQALMANKDFNLKDTVEEIISLFEVQTSLKKQDFISSYQIDNNCQLQGDSIVIKQILINLLTNAVKFTPEGGKIVFETTTIPNGNKTSVEFVITDNGIGMSESFIQKLYQPYSQDENVSQLYGGSGLGMMIVKKLISSMGGTINVKSFKSKGTTFMINIDFNNVESNLLTEFRFPNRKILVVEDSEINIEILKEFLSITECSFDIARDGLEGYNLFKNSKEYYYDLILMDMRMPNVDGCKCTKLIRDLKRKDVEDLKIIALSANCMEEDINQALECGMNDYVFKPINSKSLYKVLKKYICNKAL